MKGTFVCVYLCACVPAYLCDCLRVDIVDKLH